jgi:hypothetical protein
MKVNALFVLAAFFLIVLFSYSPANAQNDVKTKDTVSKPDPATQPASKMAEPTFKHSVVVTDTLADSANKAASPTAAADKPKSTSKSFGGNMVTVTDNVVGRNFDDGKWLTVTKWDGTKWVSKREFFPNKKQ